MDNYQCISYGCMAVRELKKRKEEITERNLKAEMIYLMDMYSESEIYKKYQQEN